MSTTVSSEAAAPTVPAQGGIIEGADPIAYNPKEPINLFIIQALVIIVFCRLLHYPLSKIGQPRVIAEVIGGVLLGPSVMGRIPGFSAAVFNPDSMPVLNNVANVGLLLFLFLIGLEVDTRMFKQNWRVAASVGLAGMILPFSLGVAIAVGLFHEFRDEANMEGMSFGTFALFIGTALSITAFPVLCRILVELNLLGSPVGVTVLAAGVGNDVIGWVLLALSVALVNNANGLAALYVFLTAVGWVLFLVFAVKPVFHWFLRKKGSLHNGPSAGVVSLTLLMVLASSWFTAAIGVHAIFGAFLVGVICPHHGGFAIKLTEKLEDLVAALFLPLYFALSGLRTNLGLLDTGMTWAYVIGITAVAFVGKICGGTLAARAHQALWRESITIGVLMSCKGLVELIVLNIGLQAGLLSVRTFTMFVVMALVTTVATTPLTKLFYPPWYRKKVEMWKRGEIDWDGNPLISEAQATEERMSKALDKAQPSRVAMHLRLDTLSGLFNIVSLLGNARRAVEQPPNPVQKQPGADGDAPHAPPMPAPKPLEVHGIRLLELTDRTSSVMQSAELDELADQDAVFSTFQTFSQLNGVAVAGHVAVVPTHLYADTLVEHAKEAKADLMFVPWSSHGGLTEDSSLSISDGVSNLDRFHSRTHIEFAQAALRLAPCTTGIYISPNRDSPSRSKRPAHLRRTRTGLSVQSGRNGLASLPPPGGKVQHILMPFIGGPDDQAALLLVLQLVNNPQVVVTVALMKFSADAEHALSDGDHMEDDGVRRKEVELEPSARDLELLSTARQTLRNTTIEPRVTFVELDLDAAAAIPERTTRLIAETFKDEESTEGIVVLGRRHACFTNLEKGDGDAVEKDFQSIVGVLGDVVAKAETKSAVLVMSAGQEGSPVAQAWK